MAPSSSDSSIQVPTSKQVPSIHELYHLLFHKDEHIMKPFIHKLIPSSSTSSSSTNTDAKKVQQDVVRNIQIQPWTKKSSSSKTTTTTTIEEERRITFQLVNLPIPKLFSSLFSSSSSSSSNNNNNNNNNNNTTTTKSSHDKKEEVIIDVNMQFQTTTTIDATTIQIKCPITFSSSTASSHDDLSFVTFFDVQLEWTLINNQNTMIVNMKSHGRLNHSTANWIPMFQSTIQQFIQKKQKTWIQLAQQQLSSSSSIPKSSARTTTTTTAPSTNINDKKSSSTTSTTTTTTTSTTTSNNHNDQSDKKKQKKSLVMKMMKPFLLSTNWTKKKQKDTDEKNNSATTNNNDLDDSLIVMMNAIQAFFSFLWFYLCVVYHFVIHLFHQVQSQFSDVSSSSTTTTASKDKKNNKQQQQQLNTGAVVSNGVNKIRKRLFSSS